MAEYSWPSRRGIFHRIRVSEYDLGSCLDREGQFRTDRSDCERISGSAFTQQDGDFTVTTGKVVGLFAGLMFFHGLLVSGPLIVPSSDAYRYFQNCLSTKYLAKLTSGFVFVNLGATSSRFPVITVTCHT